MLAHDTAVRFACATPRGFGLTTVDHLAPFQCSTKVLNEAFSDSGLVAENPTAEQSVAVAHDTPTSTPSVDPVGLGLGTMDQLDPFQRSMSVAENVLPTAKQLFADVHETPARPAPTSPAGCGLGTIDHVEPFHRSMNESVNVPPTAKQFVADAHDTAETEPLGGPGGLALGVIDHTGRGTGRARHRRGQRRDQADRNHQPHNTGSTRTPPPLRITEHTHLSHLSVRTLRHSGKSKQAGPCIRLFHTVHERSGARRSRK